MEGDRNHIHPLPKSVWQAPEGSFVKVNVDASVLSFVDYVSWQGIAEVLC